MRVPQWVYRLRAILLTPPLVFAAFLPRFEVENDLLVWPLAISIFCVGLAIRVWGQQHLHYTLRKTRPRQLVTTGPYRFVRNPLYVGNIVIGVGATIASEVIWLAPVTLIWWIVVYSFVVRYEESHLLEQHGEEYRKYMAEIPRWFPRHLSLKRAELINSFFGRSLLIETRCVWALAPFILKEILSSYLKY
jgi:protein-S-isoprenylcysteine O-methyltransferase Ste14